MNEQIIIHVTGSIKALKSILESSCLRLSYSKEDFCIGDRKVSRAAHPMVCFCQYNINELDSKTITYGKYGVAFSMEWALKKGISPVLYIDGKSLAAKGLATLLRARRNKDEKLPRNVRLSIIEIKCFTKNVRGYNSKLKKNNFIFKDENEWRYVPMKSRIGGNLISQSLSKFKENPTFYNNKLLPYPLKFKASDVKAIFVATKADIMQLSKELPKYSSKIQVANWKT
jgi:hypothetical protein